MLLSALITVNVAALWLMGWDKARSREAGRRIPERVFWLLAISGGAAGIWLGMVVFRHKTQVFLFQFGIPCIVLAQLGLLAAFQAD